MIAAIDFETYYKKKQFGINELGSCNYFKETDIYLVSIATDDGGEYVGSPYDFDWAQLKDATVVSHNAAFDIPAYHEVCNRRPKCRTRFKTWRCTANMTRFLGVEGGLSTAVSFLLKPIDIGRLRPSLRNRVTYYVKHLDKTIRDDLSGKKWEDLDEAFKKDVITYAAGDAWLCLALYLLHGHKMPAHYWWVSKHYIDAALYGLPSNLDLINECLRTINENIVATTALIPWNGRVYRRFSSKTGKELKPAEAKLFSIQEAHKETRELGIEPPTSTSVMNESYRNWLAEHGEKCPWYDAMNNLRSLNRTETIIQTARAYLDKDKLRIPFQWKGFGAHTGRPTASGLNLLNMTKREVGGVFLRHMFQTHEGYEFISADYSQIEPRVCYWLVENNFMLERIADGMDIYEAYARQALGWKSNKPLKGNDDHLRLLAKISVLGMNYRAGGIVIQASAANFGVKLTIKEAKNLVNIFRRANGKLVRFWRTWDRKIDAHIGKSMFIDLPSGRQLRYHGIRRDRSCVTQLGSGRRTFLHGGVVMENLCQAIATDVLYHNLPKIHALAPVRLHVYDEILAETPVRREPERSAFLDNYLKTMAVEPDWADVLQIAADGYYTTKFTKD